MQPRPPRPSGFSLIELATAVAIFSFVIALGLPAWQSWAARWQVQATIDTLGRGLARTRSEAMATGRTLAFQPGPLPEGLHWLTGPPPIRFGATGGATPGTLTVCPVGLEGQSLVVSRTGRIRGTRANCGFALAEVLVGLLVLAVGSLAVQQALLTGTASAVQQDRSIALLDAALSGAEALRAVEGAPASMPAALLEAWTRTFSATGGSCPSVEVRLEDSLTPANARVIATAGLLRIESRVDP